MDKLLKDRVAVITGAGRGIGRAHALAMASQGAKVVVNDLGVDIDGTGYSGGPADQVVDEIVNAGGTAVANYDSVATLEGAERIIETAVAKFGRLDILVNNAAFEKDNTIFEMTDEEFDMVQKTVLYGAFYCTRSASRIMREQRYGRIINTASLSGMGNTEQANYSAAKEGIVGFTRTVARDVLQYGITCNAIRPRAGTRLVLARYDIWEERLGKEKADELEKYVHTLNPEDVSPLVVYLASEQADYITCCVFDVFSNFIAIYDDPPRFQKTMIKKGGRWTPAELVQLMPETLTADIEPPGHTFARRVTPDATGWEWDGSVINKTQAVAL